MLLLTQCFAYSFGAEMGRRGWQCCGSARHPSGIGKGVVSRYPHVSTLDLTVEVVMGSLKIFFAWMTECAHTILQANSEAQLGKFTGPHPVPGGGRILQALRFGGAGK